MVSDRTHPAKVNGHLLGVAGLVALAALLALAAGATAQGTGVRVIADPSGDASQAMDMVRVGAGSQGTTLYVWAQVDTPLTQSKPTTTEFGNLPVQYFFNLNYGGSWCAQYFVTSSSAGVITPYDPTGTNRDSETFASACGGPAGYRRTISARWVCNELEFAVPFSSLMTPIPGNPAVGVGTTITFQNSPDDGVSPFTSFQRTSRPGAGWTDGAWNGLTYRLGDAFAKYQAAPTITGAKPVGDNSIELTWSAGAATGAQPTTYYRVYRSDDGGSSFSWVGETSDTKTSFIDTSIPAQGETIVPYKYVVSAVNCPELSASTATPPSGQPVFVGGEGPRSSAFSVGADFRPVPPTGFNIQAMTAEYVNLTWTVPADCPSSSCTPSSGTGASGILDYEVYRSMDGIVDATDQPVCPAPTCTSNFVNDTGVDEATTYWYAVRARDNRITPNVGPFSEAFKVETPVLNVAPTAAPAEAMIDQDSGMNILDVAKNTVDPFYSANDGPVAHAGNHTVTKVGTPTLGTVAITADGLAVEYTPFAGVYGTDTFSFNITDGLAEDSSVFTVKINALPTPGGDMYAVPIDASVTLFDVLANDSDPYHGTPALDSVGAPAHGSATLSDGKVAYTPLPGFHGLDMFTYRVSDGRVLSSAPVKVHVNAPPTTTNDAYSVKKGSVELALPVLQNDDDPYYSDWSAAGGPVNDTLPELRIVQVSQPGQGDAITDGRSVYYTPDFGSGGTDQFTYTVSDGMLTAQGTVDINILPGIDLRVKPLVVTEGGAATVTDQELLVDDQVSADEELVFTVTTSPVHGTLLLSGAPLTTGGFTQQDVLAGRVSYEHGGGEVPTDKLGLLLTNSTDGTWTITFRFTVTPVDDPPIATTGTIMVPVGVEIPLGTTVLSLSDVDSPDSSLSILLPPVSPYVEFRRDGVAVSGFLYTELKDGMISAFGLAEGKQVLSIQISDAGSAVAADLPVWVDAANTAPFLTGSGHMAVDWGKSALVTDSSFGWDDDYDTKADRPTGIVLVLAQAPLRGDLLMGGVPMGVGDRFSQHDIQVGLVSYRHGGVGPDSDLIGFLVIDTTAYYPGATFDFGTLNVAINVPMAHGVVDPDNDGIHSANDPCRSIADPDFVDADGDGVGAACDPDDHMGATIQKTQPTEAPVPPAGPSTEFQVQDLDEDGVVDVVDNCPSVSNLNQADMDDDRIGDRCDTDMDGDEVPEAGARVVDNCPGIPNPGQEDRNGDGVGDACSQHGEDLLDGTCRDCEAAQQPIHAAPASPRVRSEGAPPAAIAFGTLLMLIVGAGVTVWAVQRGMRR